MLTAGAEGLTFDDLFASLKPRERKFVLKYLETGDGPASVIDAGYSKANPHLQAARLLKKVRESGKPNPIAICLDLFERETATFSQQINKEALLAEQAKIAFHKGGELPGFGKVPLNTKISTGRYLIEYLDRVEQRNATGPSNYGLPEFVLNTCTADGWDNTALRSYRSDNVIMVNFSQRQSIAFHALPHVDELLYGGAGSGGKSFWLRWTLFYLWWWIPGVKVMLYRRLRRELKENHLLSTGGLLPILKPWIDKRIIKFDATDMTLFHPNGAQFSLVYLDHLHDLGKIQGPEYQFTGGDEATQMPREYHEEVRARTRNPGIEMPERVLKDLPGMDFEKNLYGSNPGWIGHGYFKRGFVDLCPHGDGVPFKAPTHHGDFTRAYVRATVDDNKAITDAYRKRLEAMGNVARRKAMRYGDWDILEGVFFGDVYDPFVHVIPAFKIPPTWYVWRGYDHGFTSDPYYCCWLAESDGSVVDVTFPTGDYDEDGEPVVKTEKRYWPAGTIFVIHELYGVGPDGKKHNGMYSPEIADAILAEDEWLQTQHPNFSVDFDGVADSQIKEERDGDSPWQRFYEAGIVWELCTKGPGSVAAGLELLSMRFAAHHPPRKLDGERVTGSELAEWRMRKPGLVFFQHCKHIQRMINEAVRDEVKPNEITKASEKHGIDALIYGAKHRPYDYSQTSLGV